MWNEDVCSKVLERLRSLKSLNNLEIEDDDVCVMPFEEVRLVCKSGSLPKSISLTAKPISFLRSNEQLDFCLLCDASSSAYSLAHDFRQNPEFTLNEWQLELECRGISTEYGTATAGLKRPTFSFNISIQPNDEIASKLLSLKNKFNFLVYFELYFILLDLPASLPAGCSSGDQSAVIIAPAQTVDVDHPASLTQSTAEPPPLLKQFDAVVGSDSPFKEEKVNVNQLQLASGKQPFSSGDTSISLLKKKFPDLIIFFL